MTYIFQLVYIRVFKGWFPYPVVPLSRDKCRRKNPGTNPFVPGRTGTKSLPPQKKQEKDVLKQEKDILKQEKDILKQKR